MSGTAVLFVYIWLKLLVVNCVKCKMNITFPQCTSQSIGQANQLITTLVQTLLVAHCAISPREFWPADHGEVAVKKGESIAES